MATYEYNVVPAPGKGTKTKGARTAADRFAISLETVMNAQAAEGWEYQRTDTLPGQERDGLFSKTTVFQHMMVFRRPAGSAAQTEPTAFLEDHSEDAVAEVVSAPEEVSAPSEPEVTARAETTSATATEDSSAAADDTATKQS